MNALTYTKPRLKSLEKIKLCPAWYSEFGRSKTTSAQLRLTRAKRAQSFISCTSDTKERHFCHEVMKVRASPTRVIRSCRLW